MILNNHLCLTFELMAMIVYSIIINVYLIKFSTIIIIKKVSLQLSTEHAVFVNERTFVAAL